MMSSLHRFSAPYTVTGIILIFWALYSDNTLIAQQTQTQWSSVTLRRVNLRQTPSIRSIVKTVLNEGTPVRVMKETPEWLYVSVVSGDSGWVSIGFIASKAEAEQLSKTQIIGRQTQKEKSKDTLKTGQPEFLKQREPVNISQSDSVLRNNFLWIVLLSLSLLGNIVLFVRLLSHQRTPPRVLGADNSTVITELEQVKKANVDLKNQLSIAQDNYSKTEIALSKTEKDFQMQKTAHQKQIEELNNTISVLENTLNQNTQTIKSQNEQIEKTSQESKNLKKELENLQKQLSKSTENLQQQAIKFTLAEQTHKEELKNKENKLKHLQEQIDTANQKYSDLEKETAGTIAELKKNNDSLLNKTAVLEKALETKEKELINRTTQLRKEFETSLDEKIEARLNEARVSIKNQSDQEKEALTLRTQREKDALQEMISSLLQQVTQLEKSHNEEHRIRTELETKIADLELNASAKESALEDLQKEYTTLLTIYEKTQQQLKQTESFVSEGILLTTTPAEIPDVSAQEPGAAKQPSRMPPREPVAKDKQFDEYARSFFKKISTL
jgi:myosin heavy subunit